MAIGKDISLNHYSRADGPLNGKTASVDGGLYPLDDDSAPSFIVTHTPYLCMLSEDYGANR